MRSFVCQGHPTTVFCLISGRRRKYCLEFCTNWGQLKKSRWPFHSCTIFEAYLINSLRFSGVSFFTIHTMGRLFLVGKREPKIFAFKNTMERGIKQIFTFAKIRLKFSGIKFWIRRMKFEKTHVPLGWLNRFKFYSPISIGLKVVWIT